VVAVPAAALLFSTSPGWLVNSCCCCALISVKLEAKSMTAIAIAVTPMAIPDEANKEEDVLIISRTEEISALK
jgi:hypothetical protein